MRYYLRIEAVNLSNFISDTNDLNTIRGGGLLLLDAPDHLIPSSEPSAQESAHQIQPFDTMGARLEKITTGASSGLYAFEVQDDREAQALVDSLREHVDTEPRLRHATFVVDAIPQSDSFALDKSRLMTRNRLQQLRQPTITSRAPETSVETTSIACEKDLVRPALAESPGPEGRTLSVSESVRVRREYGQRQKQAFYQERIRRDLPVEDQSTFRSPRSFVRELESLSTARRRRTSGINVRAEVTGLDGKMAVIYLDGNSFGKIQQAFCSDEFRQKTWDASLKASRAKVMHLFFQDKHDPDTASAVDWYFHERQSNEYQFQVETLLWGGDEIIWVVPAWQGWQMLQFFYQHWNEDNLLQVDARTLTHGAGLVFCHHKAPIQRVVSLARKLGDLAKQWKDENCFAYEVLESFDHITTDLHAYRRTRVPRLPNATPEDVKRKVSELVLRGTDMAAIGQRIRQLKREREFPRRALHQVASGYLDGPEAGRRATDRFEQLIKSTCGPDVLEHLSRLDDLLSSQDTKWFHLLQLWDYVF